MKTKKCTRAEAERERIKRGKGTWEHGLFPPQISAEPCDIIIHSRWKPILPIPLSRAHICTLHAQVRIIEKILHLHFEFIWTQTDLERRAQAIESIEKSLSAIGVEHGNCQLKQDLKKSGKNAIVVLKPSLSGRVACKLFQGSTWSGFDKVWKEVCVAESNCLDQGNGRKKRWTVWETLEDLQPYLTGLVLTQGQRDSCREKMDAFGKAFLEAFGETHVTHYIVRYLSKRI